MPLPFSSIDTVVQTLAQGGMVVVTDDEDRENEGDLVAAAEKITPEMVNFMATHGRGLICAPISEVIAKRLGLTSMVPVNRESFGTAFTVSVDAATGITTGISAADRALTLNLLANESTQPEDLVQPGHIFPLLARDGGVLRRAGHTEASVDLVRMAGLGHAAVICEILKDDGSMARLDDLLAFAKKHSLPICTIETLITHRREREKLVLLEHVEEINTAHGPFQAHYYRCLLDDLLHLALVRGTIDSERSTLVRVQRADVLEDIFGPSKNLIHASMEKIADEGSGVLLYMRPREQVRPSEAITGGIRRPDPMDLRDYGTGAQILHDLGVRQLRLLTNNTQRKVVGLEGHDLHIVEQVPLTPETPQF